MELRNHRKLFLLGSSHHQTPIGVREQFVFSDELIAQANPLLMGVRGLQEVVFLSTCNRVEIYGVASHELHYRSFIAALASWSNTQEQIIDDHCYWMEGCEVVEHLFAVSSGFDSCMIGETEIFGQVKSAYMQATQQASVGTVLNRLFQKAFQAAKWVRTHTAIGRGTVSTGNVAAELAMRVCGDLSQQKVLLVGTGKIGERTLQALTHRGAQDMVIASRSPGRAGQLARQFSARALSISQIQHILHEVDIVLSATTAANPILSYDWVREHMQMRSQRPLFLIDLSVPRTLDPRCEGLRNVHLYNIDDLGAVSNQNLQARKTELLSGKNSLQRRAEALWATLQPRLQPTLIPNDTESAYSAAIMAGSVADGAASP